MKAPSARTRLLVVVVVAAFFASVTSFFTPWQFAALAGWNAAAATFVAWVWLVVRRFTPEETREFATREDTNRLSTSLLLLSAAVASLVGTAFDLVKATESHSAGRAALTAIGVLTVALSWTLVHTVFALHYAREYYTPPVGGIDFKSRDEKPDYQDFAYIAFTIGMTFQVSDTDVQIRRIRRVVVRHALLSYLFGAVILAVVVNLIASLVK